MPNALEGEWRQRDRIERHGRRVRDPLRMRQRIEHRKLHARRAHLRKDAAVDELHEAVHDALRMHDDIDLREIEIEQIMGLDHLERFVGQRRAVDRDLLAHAPRGMTQRLFDGSALESLATPIAEGSSRRREHDAPHVLAASPRDALQNRAVLAVDWNDLAPALLDRSADKMAGHHERLFVRERNPLAAFERRERRVETNSADYRVQHDINVGPSRGFDETLTAAGGPMSDVTHPQVGTRPISAIVLDKTDERRPEYGGLLLQKIGVGERRQRGDTKAIAVTRQNPQRSRSDAAGRAQNGHTLPAAHRGAGTSNQPKNRCAVGSTNRMLSMRSSTPP